MAHTVKRFSRLRVLIGASASGAALFATVLFGAAPAQAAEPGRGTAASTGAASQPAAPAACSGTYQGDERLGPQYLPKPWQDPVGPLVLGYHRTGHLSPTAFLATYWDPTGGSWKYPPNDGFANRPDGSLDKRAVRLRVGEDLDRFGSEYGAFLAPAGASYARRALPPQSLITREAAYPCAYHSYEVTKSFTVWEGRIAPWFEQRGGGEQIKLDPSFVDPGAGQKLNVKWLLDHGYLKAETNVAAARSALAGVVTG
ncbi:TNT domain-containing protein [Streptomyces noboritoensis]|uniref:TNT domain-containing protein n=1 Tax=Streptomyces noboritoensis TaxID=67337 RepID=A0ABV6TW11_9ACTN